jgi:hypothetical protein
MGGFMTIVIDGSGTITGAATLATTVTSPTLTTPIVTTTIGVGGATPSASGSGITFPATQSASTNANTLDDYEEGSWTPALDSTGATFVYSTALGTYTKVGKLVHASCFVQITSITGASATQVNITGLPFPAGSTNSSYGLQAVTLDSLTASLVGVGAQIAPGATQATLLGGIGTTTSHFAVASNQLTTSTTVRLNAIYQSAS